MTLSVCCVTNDSGPRVRALLNLLRPAADQIVVAVDSRVSEARLGDFVAVADRVVRFEYADPMESVSAWLATLCTGDWIFRVDDDEVPSPALIRALPALQERTDVHQFHIRCRWLFPDTARYLDEPPWNYLSPRLVRNDPATLRFDGRLHSGVITQGLPARVILDQPFYHLNTLLRSEPARRQVFERRYRGVAERWKSHTSDRDSRLYCLPETAIGPLLGSVPQSDRVSIEHVLDAGGTASLTPLGLEVPLFGRAEIERHWSHRSLKPTAYRAVLAMVERDLRFRPGQHRPIRLRVTNRGDDHWPGGELEPWIRAAYRWRHERGDGLAEGYRTNLPGPVAPGRSIVVPLLVAAPRDRGAYALDIDLVHEHARWFGCAVSARITVEE